eukprot:gene19430-26088_t
MSADIWDTAGQERFNNIWDTAGQERFNSMHSSYYYRAHACIMVFDVTRKLTYKNLETWYDELQHNCKGLPTIVVANKIDVDYKNLETWFDELQHNCKGLPTIVVASKIDVDYKVTSKSFNFAAKRKLPFFFVSASDGTNVVKIFQMAIMAGIKWKSGPKEDFYQEVLDLLGDISLDSRRELEAAVLHEAEKEKDKAEKAAA